MELCFLPSFHSKKWKISEGLWTGYEGTNGLTYILMISDLKTQDKTNDSLELTARDSLGTNRLLRGTQ